MSTEAGTVTFSASLAAQAHGATPGRFHYPLTAWRTAWAPGARRVRRW